MTFLFLVFTFSYSLDFGTCVSTAIRSHPGAFGVNAGLKSFSDIFMHMNDPGENMVPGCQPLDESIIAELKANIEAGEDEETINEAKDLLKQAKEYNEKLKPKMVPPVSIYDSSLPTTDAAGAETKKLFQLLKEKIESSISFQEDRAKDHKDCMRSSSFDKCLPVHPAVKEMFQREDDDSYVFSDLVRDARYQLLLAPGGKLSDKGKLNTSLTSNVYKEKDWSPTASNSDDKKFAEKKMAVYRAEAEEYARKRNYGYIKEGPEYHKLRRAYLEKKRKAHQAAYETILTSNPILQFITSENPNQKDVNEAVDGVLASIAKEKQFIAENAESLNTDGALSTDLLKLLNYSTELKDVLEENPEFCSLARVLLAQQGARVGGAYAGGLIVMMASSLFPPAYAVAAGFTLVGGVSAGYIMHAQSDVDTAKLQVVGRSIKAPNNPEMEKLMEAKSYRDTEVYMAPLMFVGMNTFQHVKNLKNTKWGKALSLKRLQKPPKVAPSVSSYKDAK